MAEEEYKLELVDPYYIRMRDDLVASKVVPKFVAESAMVKAAFEHTLGISYGWYAARPAVVLTDYDATSGIDAV